MPAPEQSTESLIRERLTALDPERIEIVDDSARHAGHPGAREGGHFRLRVVAPVFAGKTPLARHRLVIETLGELMQCRIHAVSIQALTPDESRQAGPARMPLP